MLLAHILTTGGEASDSRQGARDLLGARGRALASAQELIDRLPNDRRVGGLPAARLTVDRRDLATGELDLLPLHTTMMAYDTDEKQSLRAPISGIILYLSDTEYDEERRDQWS